MYIGCLDNYELLLIFVILVSLFISLIRYIIDFYISKDVDVSCRVIYLLMLLFRVNIVLLICWEILFCFCWDDVILGKGIIILCD